MNGVLAILEETFEARLIEGRRVSSKSPSMRERDERVSVMKIWLISAWVGDLNCRYSYPRPISEPPSPASSRATTPAPSQHASDVEDDDSHDSEQEAEELAANLTENLKLKAVYN